MSKKKITVTIEYKAGSDFQEQYLDSLVNVFMEGLKFKVLREAQLLSTTL